MEKATMSLADCAREASREPLLITDRGKPVVVVLPLENTGLETAFLNSDPDFLKLIERSRTRMKREGGVPSSEVRRQLGLS